jgi:hypothetical protein
MPISFTGGTAAAPLALERQFERPAVYDMVASTQPAMRVIAVPGLRQGPRDTPSMAASGG